MYESTVSVRRTSYGDLPSEDGDDRPWPEQSSVLLRVLDEIDYGLIIAKPDGQVRYANQIARVAIRQGLLTVHDGRLCTSSAEEQAILARAIRAAQVGRRGLISLRCRSTELPVATVPLPGAGYGFPDEALCLLVLGKQQTCESLTMEFFSRSYGLTQAEEAVLRGLCRGRKPKELARELGVAISTVRTQIGSVRDKTRTESIGELTLRVAVLPPIAPALKSGWSVMNHEC